MSSPSASTRLSLAGIFLLGFSSVFGATQTSTVAFTINHGTTVSTGSTSILGTKASTDTSGPGTVSLPQFNAATGTLTGASITISTTTSTAGVSKSGSLSLLSAATYSSTLRADITAGGVTRTGQNTASTVSASLLGLLNLSGVQQANGASLNTTFTIVDPVELAAFVGTGTFTTAFSTSDSLSISTLLSFTSGVGITASGTYSGNVDVTYTYTPAVVITAPSISVGPAAATVSVGGLASFSVTATGSAPFSYQWLKNGVPISGATSATLALSNVDLTNAGNYSVTVSNSAGSATSSAATLTVNPIVSAPVIGTQPVAQSATAGGNVTFSVGISGVGLYTYQWSKDGVAIPAAIGSSLTLTNVQVSDSGTYSVAVTGVGGTTTSAGASLTVSPAVVVTAPSITSQPSGLTLSSGGAINLSLSASGTAPFTYQWYKNLLPVSGATSATFSVANATVADSGTYYATVANSAGTATSSSAIVVVLAAPPVSTPPSIGAQPSSQTVTAGSPVTFNVSVTGSAPFTYQWKKDGVAILTAISSSLTLGSAQVTDSGTYSVVISGPGGSTTSAGAILTVNPAAPVATAPAITSQPAGLTLSSGGAINLSVTASGTLPITYQWYKNAVAISGATSATFSVANAVVADSGTYSVVVTNSAGSTTSSNAVVVVLTAPPVATAPSIGTQPSSQVVSVGSPVTFNVSVTGSAPFTYQWKKDGAAISGATNSSLTLASVQVTDAGTYSVSVSGPGGSTTSAGAVLTVNTVAPVATAPVITSQPSGLTLSSGGAINLSVAASGTAPFSYQWYKNGAVVSGATSANFSLTNAATTDSGTYYAVVTNSAGSATSANAIVVVLAAPATATAPSIGSQPTAQTATVGDTVTFSLSVTGSAPFSYQWSKDGVAISGATSPVLTLTNVQTSATGGYSVVVSNSVGSITSVRAQLTVQAAITTPGGGGTDTSGGGGTVTGGGTVALPVFALLPQPKTARVGTSVTFTTIATGTGLTYQWLKNGAAILGATLTLFTIDNVQPSDAGDYSVIVQNAAGSVVSPTAALVVDGTATIPAKPAGRLVNLSTRSEIGTGGNILIGGFIIGGTDTQTLLIRAVGPSLAQFGMSAVLARPKLTLYSGNQALLSNSDWTVSDVLQIATQMATAAGAFPLNPASKDAAAVVTLKPGAYTVTVEGLNNGTGTGLIELYNVTTQQTTALGNDIVNLSSRGRVGKNDQVVIAGFVVGGSSPKTMLIRGVGPSLAKLGVPDTLADPKLTIYRGSTVIKDNNDWTVGNDPAAIRRVSRSVGAFALDEKSADAVMLITLDPGTYTAVISSQDNSEGVALVEIYEVP